MFIQVGTPYDISIKIVDDNGASITDDTVVVVIKDKTTATYFNGMFWVGDECEIFVPHHSNGIYEYTFTPEIESSFEITITSKNYPFAKGETIHSYVNDPSLGLPIEIGSDNFENQDGTDTVIVDINNKPVVGVKVSCYNKETREIVSVAQTDTNGKWKMLIPRGVYFFMFEKDGYISVSFERTV